MFKFIHAADLHLDSPLKGLQRYEGAPAEMLRTATRRALENLVQLALDQSVQFVVIAGDIYDGNWHDFQTGLFFVRQMGRLQEAGVPVYMIAGNHDAANKMTKNLRLPDNVQLLPHDKPAVRELEAWGVAIHGQSFATQAIKENLARAYLPARKGCFNIGLLHTCAGGYEGHECYAPCCLDDLRSKGYDYWALGHVHQRQALAEADPVVMFAGNMQGRHIREAGPKGCLVVDVDDRGRPSTRFEPLDVLRWQRCPCPAAGLEHPDDILQPLADKLRSLLAEAGGRPLAVRIEIQGACRAHEQLAGQPQRWQNEIRALGNTVGPDQLWIEQVKLATCLPAGVELPEEGPLAELLELLGELRSGEAELGSLAADLADLARRLPAELQEGDDALKLSDPARLCQLLGDVQPLLLDRLRAPGSRA